MRARYIHPSILGAAISIALAVALMITTLVVARSSEAAPRSGSVKGCGGQDVTLKIQEKRMLARHNEARVDRGKPRLCVDPKLQRVAREHSRDMMQRDYFSHTTKGSGESGCDRMRDAGYRWINCAENISWGQDTSGYQGPSFMRWMESSGHRQNILNADYREVGIGAVNGEFRGNDNVTMWTADFGRR